MANLNFTNSVDFTTHPTLTPEFNFFISGNSAGDGQQWTVQQQHNGEDDNERRNGNGRAMQRQLMAQQQLQYMEQRQQDGNDNDERRNGNTLLKILWNS